MRSYREAYVNPLKKKIILITGENQSGKTFVAKLVSLFGKTDTYLIDYFIENLISFYKLKNIKLKLITNILNNYINYYLINKNLGRNYNLKPNEETSIYNLSPNKLKSNLKQINKEASKINLEKNFNRNNELIITLHNVIPVIEIFLKAFPHIKIINVVNHPVDQIYATYKKHKRFGKNSYKIRDATLLYKYKNKKFNIYAKNLEKNYSSLTKINKILMTKYQYEIEKKRKLKLLKNKNIFLEVKYDEFFLKNKKKLCNKIKFFLKKKDSISSINFLKSKEFNYRKKNIKNRNKNKKYLLKIFKGVSKKIFKKMIINYENSL